MSPLHEAKRLPDRDHATHHTCACTPPQPRTLCRQPVAPLSPHPRPTQAERRRLRPDARTHRHGNRSPHGESLMTHPVGVAFEVGHMFQHPAWSSFSWLPAICTCTPSRASLIAEPDGGGDVRADAALRQAVDVWPGPRPARWCVSSALHAAERNQLMGAAWHRA